jgi:hypothetical protein
MPDKPLAHPLKWWQFYAACFHYATSGAWGKVGDVSTLLAFAPQLVKTLWPHAHAMAAAFLKARGSGDDLLWKFPLWIGGAILLARLLTAPFIIYKDKPSIGNDSVAPEPPLARPRIKLEWYKASPTASPFFRLRNDGEVAAHLVEASVAVVSGRVLTIDRVSRVGTEEPIPCFPVLTDGSGITHPTDSHPVIEFLKKAAKQGYITRAREERALRRLTEVETSENNSQAETDLALMQLREITDVPLPANRVDLTVSFDVVYYDFDRRWRYATPHVLTYRDFERWVTINLASKPEPPPTYVGEPTGAVDTIDVRLEGTFPGTFALHATGHACEVRTGPIVVEAAMLYVGKFGVGEQIVPTWQPRFAIEFPVISDLRDSGKEMELSLFYDEGDRSRWPESGTKAAMTQFLNTAQIVRRYRAAQSVLGRDDFDPQFSNLSIAELESIGSRVQQPFEIEFGITYWNSERTQQWRRSEKFVYEPSTGEAFIRHSGAAVPLVGGGIGA